jgi:hypothetical protein
MLLLGRAGFYLQTLYLVTGFSWRLSEGIDGSLWKSPLLIFFKVQTGKLLDLKLFLLLFPGTLQNKYSIFFHEILPSPHLLHEEKMR